MGIKHWAAGASALVLAIGVGAATPASATRMVATYTGVVLSGSDLDGVFGPAFALLNGLPYTAVYRYDTDLGIRTTTPGVADQVSGGLIVSAPSPITYAGLTINGVTVQVMSVASGLAQTSDQVVQHGAALGISAYTDFLFNQVLNGSSPTSLEEPFSGFGDFNSFGGFGIYDSHVFLEIRAEGTLTSETVTIARASVPEPAAWSLMIAGFGMAGAVLRRRRLA